MIENTVLLYLTTLILIALAYFIFFYKKGKKHYFYKENNETHLQFNSGMESILQQKSEEKRQERIRKVDAILDNGDEDMTYQIPLPADIQLLETDICFLIKGSVKSIRKICDELAAMEQLPQGYCMQLGNWHFFVLDDFTQSSREDKIVVLPANYWLFMSCKFRDSLLGEDIHPYQYNFEPFTFKKVLEYGIGVEATDYQFT